MADRRVVIQFTTPEQEATAEQLLGAAEKSGRLLYGTLPEERIPELEQHGLAVDLLDEDTQPELRGATGGAPPPTARSAFADAAAADTPSLVEPPRIRPVDVWVLQLSGPLLPQWRERLTDESVELLEHQGGLRYTARLHLTSLPAVNHLPFIESLRPYGLRDTVHPAQLTARVLGRPAAEPSTYELLVHRPDDVGAVLGWLEQHDVHVVLSTDRKIRFTSAQPQHVQQLAALPEVASIYDFVRPTPSNNRARVLVGIDSQGPPPTPELPQTGSGQLVGVADSGLDANHPDFQGRIQGLVARGRPGDPSDPSGHGTHVAGSILGAGAASNRAIRGMAPDADLFFQSVMDAKGEFSGLDPSLSAVLQEAYDAGVRIHNDSWGVAGAASGYRADSLEIDEFVASHPDMLVVIAAGNSGTAAKPLNAPAGYVDLLSIDTPATAKNALTVGASRSDRAPLAPGSTFGKWWPRKFPDPPIANEDVSGNPESMAAFSSRGPCDEQTRIKPDVVAPGTLILSTRASTATDPFWAEYPANAHYAYDGGTSMAAPIVTGCAALVRQYLVDNRAHEPSAALLKAILVNGTRWLSGPDAVANHATAPNYHQGFGFVSLPDSIPNPGTPWLGLEFSDTWQGDDLAVPDTGHGQSFTFQIDGTRPLRLCLAWTDTPARSLQNCLNVRLDHPDSGASWLGNADRPSLVKTNFDMGNNLQVIRLDRPPAGSYVVQVWGASITVKMQRFALAVTSALTSALSPVGAF